MFLKARTALTAALLFICALVLYRLCWPGEETLQPDGANPISATICQTREGLTKDLFSRENEKEQRLHSHLKSERSVLQIYTINGERRFIENLENISCQTQEAPEIDGQGKKLRLFQAKEGRLDYTSGSFSAQSARLSLVKIPFRGSSPESYLEGTCRDISLTFSPPSFHAEHFEATLLKDQ